MSFYCACEVAQVRVYREKKAAKIERTKSYCWATSLLQIRMDDRLQFLENPCYLEFDYLLIARKNSRIEANQTHYEFEKDLDGNEHPITEISDPADPPTTIAGTSITMEQFQSLPAEEPITDQPLNTIALTPVPSHLLLYVPFPPA